MQILRVFFKKRTVIRLQYDCHAIDGNGVTTVVGHEYVRSRLIPHVVVVSTTVIRCS